MNIIKTRFENKIKILQNIMLTYSNIEVINSIPLLNPYILYFLVQLNCESPSLKLIFNFLLYILFNFE